MDNGTNYFYSLPLPQVLMFPAKIQHQVTCWTSTEARPRAEPMPFPVEAAVCRDDSPLRPRLIVVARRCAMHEPCFCASGYLFLRARDLRRHAPKYVYFVFLRDWRHPARGRGGRGAHWTWAVPLTTNVAHKVGYRTKSYTL